MDADVVVSNRLWLELLHAEVCWALASHDIDVLVIKGPSVAEWLYPAGARESADVDVLLRPSQWDAAVAVLTERGFEPTYPGFGETETALHSLDLQRTSREQGRHGLDLHRYFPGIEVDPEDAFDALWAGRTPAQQAGVPVCYPSIEARALIIALHAARQPQLLKTAEDLRRAQAAMDDDQLRRLAALARQVNARAALRAGLETQPGTAELVERLGLSDVEVPTYWRLLSSGASPLSVEIARARTLPPRELADQLRLWVLPSEAKLRARYPEAADGRLGLAEAHARRWGSLIRRLPRAASAAVSAARRGR